MSSIHSSSVHWTIRKMKHVRLKSPTRIEKRNTTKAAIVEAIRGELLEKGPAGTTVRSVASRAHIDPALLYHYFPSKADLVTEALRLPFELEVISASLSLLPRKEMGGHLLRTLLTLLDSPNAQEPITILVRLALSDSGQEQRLKDLISRSLLEPITSLMDTSNPDLSAAVIVSQLIGVVWSRYIVRLEPIASSSVEQLVAQIGPLIRF